MPSLAGGVTASSQGAAALATGSADLAAGADQLATGTSKLAGGMTDLAAGAKAVLVAFICPHCPFVRHIRGEFAKFAKEYEAKGLKVVAIASNSVVEYPEDGPDGMKKEKAEVGYIFPYLFDYKQDVAKLFKAACTPDFFMFDGNGKLAYRGQFDGSRPKNSVPVNGADMRAATDLILAGHKPRETLGEILRFVRFLADDASVSIDETVAASEQRTGFRNYALANYMKAFGVLTNPVEMTLGVYFHQCAIRMNARQLARAGLFLANAGHDPLNHASVTTPFRAKRINAMFIDKIDGAANPVQALAGLGLQLHRPAATTERYRVDLGGRDHTWRFADLI